MNESQFVVGKPYEGSTKFTPPPNFWSYLCLAGLTVLAVSCRPTTEHTTPSWKYAPREEAHITHVVGGCLFDGWVEISPREGYEYICNMLQNENADFVRLKIEVPKNINHVEIELPQDKSERWQIVLLPSRTPENLRSVEYYLGDDNMIKYQILRVSLADENNDGEKIIYPETDVYLTNNINNTLYNLIIAQESGK